MYPILLQEFAVKRDWLTETEVLDFFAISQTIPGIIAINFSCFIGFKRRRYIGAACAAVGILLPSLVVIIVIAAFLYSFNEIEWVQKMLRGINVAVAVTLVATMLKSAKNSIKDVLTLVISAAAFFVVTLFNASIIVTIIVATIISIVYYGYIKGKIK